MSKDLIINRIVEEINKLEEAKELLECVYTYTNIYTGETNLPRDVLERIKKFFEFDDSE